MIFKSAITTLLVVISILIVGNPSQGAFIERIAHDYGKSHHGLSISADYLQNVGTLRRDSYVLFSTCTYSFGQISVNYVGIGFIMIQLPYDVADSPTLPTLQAFEV